MNKRFVVSVVGLATSLALPTFAQQKETVDQEVRQQIEAAYIQFCDAHNKHDAAAMVTLYAQDGVQIRSWESGGGLVSGQQALEKWYASEFASSPGEFVGKLVQVYPVGDEISAISEWKEWKMGGYKALIYVREGDTWKIRLEYVNLSAPQ